jgi:hypothetical protein
MSEVVRLDMALDLDRFAILQKWNNDGTPESHARKDGCQSQVNKRTHKNQSRRNDESPSRKDDGRDGLPAEENGGLSRKDEGHGFGGKSRGNEVRSGV